MDTDHTAAYKNRIFDRLIRICQNSSSQLTKSKKDVLCILLDKGAMEAEPIWLSLGSSGVKISISTIYYVLRWLEKKNLVVKTNPGRKIIYQISTEI